LDWVCAVWLAFCPLDCIAVEGCAVRNKADVAANKNLLEVDFTKDLPRNKNPLRNIES
jgi:hypothetical protein